MYRALEFPPGLLQPVGRREAPVRLAGAFVGRGGAVAAQHRAGSPAGKAHQIRLVATSDSHRCANVWAKLVRMEPFDPGLSAAPAEDLGDAGLGDGPELADLQPFQVGVRVAGADPE